MAVSNQNIKGITIEIGGNTKPLQDALKDVDKTTKGTQKELRQIDQLLKFDPKNVELLTQRQKALTDTIAATSTKLDALKQAQAEVERQFQSGEIGEEAYREFRREIIATEGRLEAFQRQAANTQARIDVVLNGGDIDQAESKLERLKRTSKDVGDKVGKNLKKGFEVGTKAAAGLAIAVGGGAIGLGAFVEENRELNTLLARLRTNADTAGFSIGKVEQAFKKVNSITGDTGAAVETVSNLLKTPFNDNQLLEVLDSINGAAIAFSDTLKTEGIADGIQETFATGAAIGPFAELLERSGVNIDKFNTGLTRAKKAGKETDYVLQQLAKTGLAENNEGYIAANANLIAYNDSQLEAQIKAAELATQLTPLATGFNNFKGILFDVALGNISFAEGVQMITDKLGELGIKLGQAAQEALPQLVESFVEYFPKFYERGTEITGNLINGISGKIPDIIKSIIDIIKLIATTVIENSPKLIQSGFQLIGALGRGLLSNLPAISAAMFTILAKLIATIITNLPQILAAGVRLIVELAKGLGSAASQVYTFFTQKLFPEIKSRFTNFDWAGLGKEIARGLANGLKNAASIPIKAAKNMATDVYNAAKSKLKIFSPSRAFRELGEFTNEGFAVGIERSTPKLLRTVNGLYGSLGSSAAQSINNNVANQTFITNNNAQNTESLIGAIMALANRPLNAMVELDGKLVGQSVDNYQFNQNNIAAALQGVSL